MELGRVSAFGTDNEIKEGDQAEGQCFITDQFTRGL